MNSRCTLYKSSLEEVSIWGWPLQTGGLIASAFSSRSFTIVTGRVTEVKFSKFLMLEDSLLSNQCILLVSF